MRPLPKKLAIVLLAAVMLCLTGFQPTSSNTFSVVAQRRSAGLRGNPDIPRIVAEINSRNIEATIRKLVSFGTRNTLSEQNNPNRGIGAARDWLYGEFQKAAAQSGGRMSVEKQTFEQAKAARVPEPTMLTNIV